jgi:hypothetical protein
LVIVFTVANYLSVTFFAEVPDAWLQMMFAKCGGEENVLPNESFHNTAFMKASMISGLFGAYFGIIIDSLYLGGTGSRINHTSFSKALVRTISSFILAGAFTLPYLTLSKKLNLLVLYAFKYGLPMFFATLFQFSYLKVILTKWNLVNKGTV